MKSKFSPMLRFVAVVILLLTAFSISPAKADEPVPDGIISAGYAHTCALMPSGAVDCWGKNDFGQAEDQPGPYLQVSAGDNHTCALTPAGAVDCWGSNLWGESEDQPGPYIQVTTGSGGSNYSCALTPSGAVDCWGFNYDNYAGQADDQPGPYTQVSAGFAHTCALTPSRAVDCWGYNWVGDADDQPGPYIQVSGGHFGHTCAITPTGAVDCWGYNSWGQSEHQLGPYTQISTGGLHTCALTSIGVVDCWGNNAVGQAEDRPGPYTQVSAGYAHTCALTPSGAVDCWGDNYYSEAGYHPGPYGAYQPIGDTTPPVVTVTGVAEGSTYVLGAVPQAGCSTTDEGSGVAVEASISLSGGNTLGVGSFTATCSGALDNAGNHGNTAVAHYNVAFQFTGFTSPVDNLPVMNIAKAGQTIPLKWRLTNANGTPITNLTAVTVTATSLPCQSGTTSDSIEEYAAGNVGLQNLGDGYYQWNWKTPTSYANSCKTLRLDFGESAGSEHTALFQFKK